MEPREIVDARTNADVVGCFGLRLIHFRFIVLGKGKISLPSGPDRVDQSSTSLIDDS
jgi:hypothetical protein